MSQGRVLSGMRPTGRLHLGRLEGALRNWVKLQDCYDCYYEIADWHALTTGFEDTSSLQENVRDLVLDWLSAGIDPQKCVVFVQSHVKDHAELHLLLSMITPTPWLIRNPSVKEQAHELGLIESLDDEAGMTKIGYGHLGYPVLQAADILIYKANFVPVGRDQVAHLEISREIVRRFNRSYGEVLVEPQPLLTEFPLLPGIDGRKMSASYGNAIYLSDDAQTVRDRVKMFFTDPRKIRRGDPGRPEICPVYTMHRLYNAEDASEIEAGCRSGSLGCVDCKTRLATRLNEALEPIRARRSELERSPSTTDDILSDGAKRAGVVAGKTMQEVRAAMNLDQRIPEAD